MDKHFEVKTTLSLEDNLALHRVHGNASRQRTVLYTALAAVCAVYLWVKQDKYALIFTILTVLLAVIAVFYARILGSLSYRKFKSEIVENTYSFYDHQIGAKSEKEDSLNEYKVFTRILESPERYFLYTQGSLVVVLPKKDFTHGNAADFGAFLAKRTGLTVKKLKK